MKKIRIAFTAILTFCAALLLQWLSGLEFVRGPELGIGLVYAALCSGAGAFVHATWGELGL